jgi:hypothetical protein
VPSALPPQDTDGSWYGLRPSDVTDVTSKKGKASIVALDAFQADRMLTLDGARLIAVWVSMNSVDGLKQRYRCVQAGKWARLGGGNRRGNGEQSFVLVSCMPKRSMYPAYVALSWSDYSLFGWICRSIVSRNKDLTPEEIERRVELLLVKATGDIEHGLLDSGYYEYTVYDDEGPDQTFQKLRDFADFALTI